MLVIELTESMVQTDQELSQKHLAALAELGVGVAMDDFGTGFSSLSLLHSMPFQSLKIDRSFLVDFYRNSPGFGRARMLIEVMINLARNMNMDVVAEGVEAAEQLDLLAECRVRCFAATAAADGMKERSAFSGQQKMTSR